VNLSSPSRREFILVVVVCVFLFFYGLSVFGLVGADEPRYAQVAREMLERGDWVTPTLGGQPWLEKPALYYWEARIAFAQLGVSDGVARVPSAFSAALLVAAVYFFLRRFRPDSQLEGALMTASSVGIIGFARSASTDMVLAANLGLALLAWFAWFESQERRWLLLGSFFLGLATLAKGPVAPVLAAVIIVAFLALQQRWRSLAQTLWWPGLLVFLITTLPWYVAVQLRNPEFFRTFILEHNFARFGTDLYRHHQPAWFYLPVLLVGLMPWAALVVAALGATVRGWWAEGRGMLVGEDAWDLFLLVWLALPVILFSLSQSKLPGYILPAIPAGTLLAASYVHRLRSTQSQASTWLLGAHSLLSAGLLVPALLLPSVLSSTRWVWGTRSLAAVGFAALVAGVLFLLLRGRGGLTLLPGISLVPVLLAVSVILRGNGPVLDHKFSARPLAAELARSGESGLPLAVFQVRRDVEYGLHFYRNQPVARYERGEVPVGAHLLIMPPAGLRPAGKLLGTRDLAYLGSASGLDYYHVFPAAAPPIVTP
jgi:4-amino-4-deoxy-L-arabinose transferase-like glycosyltransferase